MRSPGYLQIIQHAWPLLPHKEGIDELMAIGSSHSWVAAHAVDIFEIVPKLAQCVHSLCRQDFSSN
jgi:hypothetical protein